MHVFIKRFHSNSLRGQMTLLFSIIGTFLFCVLCFSFLSFYQLQYKVVRNNQEAIVSQTLREIEKNYDAIDTLSTSISYNENVQQFLTAEASDSEFALLQSVSSFLINTQSQNSSILDLSIVGFNGNSTNISGDISVTKELLNQLPKENKELYFFGKTNYYHYYGIDECILVARYIYPLNLTNQEPCGAIFIAIEPTMLFTTNYVDNNTNVLEMLFLDGNGELILGSETLYEAFKNQPNKKLFGQTSNSFNEYTIPDLNYKLVSIIPRGDMLTSLFKSVAGQFFFVFILFLLLGVILFYFTSRFFITMHKLIDLMQEISSGNRKALKKRISLDEGVFSCKEALMIASSYNNMLDQIDTLNQNIFNTYTKMYETELYAKKTELAYLRAQINPHFLYNTLALICGMSSEGHFDDIVNISLALSQILRYSIKGSEFVTVSEEFEIIKSYLMIQSTRFEDRFTIDYLMTDEALDALIPKMILQPLVENSIIHGLETKLEPGSIQIGGLRDKKDNTLVLWVSDTGVGMTEEKLKEIRHQLYNPKHLSSPQLAKTSGITPNAESSIGLSNVNSRICLYFGQGHHLIVDSKENVGTTIQIRIPYETKRSEVHVHSDHNR